MSNQAFYHVTTQTAWDEAIQKEGLQPKIGERAEEYGEEKERIYLFTSYEAYEEGMLQWLGELFDEEEPLVLLRVTLPRTIADEHITSEAEYEVAVDVPIPPAYIEFVEEM